jgi:Cof subfamily protein (haloacid dehalogenase superfamily)
MNDEFEKKAKKWGISYNEYIRGKVGMKMVKLIAIDLDGTLLDKGKYISDKNIEAIRFAQKSGIKVVIATGRANFDAQNLFKETDINPWIIGANGATIHDPSGELFYSIPLNQQAAGKMLNILEDESLYYEAFIDHQICAPNYGKKLLFQEIDQLMSKTNHMDKSLLKLEIEIQFGQSGFTFIESFRKLLEQEKDIYNILAISFDEEKLQKGWRKFLDIPELTIVKSGKHNFHLQHEQASKGNALEILAKQFNVDLADTAAVGDNYNDLPMLQIVGRSAAMGNADQEIKDLCDVVTLSNDKDGVAHFIHSLL